MRNVLLVFAGGFCGTLARYLLGLAIHPSLVANGLPLPLDILGINLTGALALGLLLGLVEAGAAIAPDARLALGTGFLGAYTTFSTFMYGGARLLSGSAPGWGIAYLIASMVLGVACARGGFLLAGWLTVRRRARWTARPYAGPAHVQREEPVRGHAQAEPAEEGVF